MPSIQEREDAVEALRAEIRELDALEAPSDEQTARFDVALTEFETAKADLDAARERQERAQRAVASGTRESGFGAPQVTIRKDPFENLEALRFADPTSDDVVARAITAVSEVKIRGVRDEHREAVVRKIEEMPGVAVHALIFGSPAYRSAFADTLAAIGKGKFPILSGEQAEAMRLADSFDGERAAFSLTGGNGGYMLPTLLDPTLIETGVASVDNLRSIARVETISQNIWHGVTVGNVTAYWTSEGADLTAGNPTMTGPSVTASKLTAYLPGSYEIFEDSSLLAQLPGLIGDGMSYVEQQAFVNGSGSGAPKGIITAISATVGSTVTVTTRGSFTSASSQDVYNLVNAVTPRYEASSTFLAHKSWFNMVNTMSPNGGGSLFWGNFMQAGWKKPPLLGYEVLTASDMPNGGSAWTSGTAIAVLGDFKQYLIVDRIGTTVEFVQNVFNGTTNLPTGQRALVAHKRVGADASNIDAFRFLKA